ncbi:Hsp20/alpha crystallin family protein [Actinocatenispora rupis]|uniref:SHSP domain-containing protein n=1 Tax=Actinocatenispora rupis TaxID=519421 RepID=A0A8J3J7L5_9ACTN|nr:Hsp20/alpha crystallin family protein [Actinocatenispora rupis]GID15533.1 hypothetical protein Aru02nite_64220 [Actinocatenispora rupis]
MTGTGPGRQPAGRDLWDWFDWPARLPWHTPPIRVEDSLEGDRYVIRAELPGIDPATDLRVTVGHGVLGIHTERRSTATAHRHAEFSYGTFDRTVSLPDGTDEDSVTARYDNGVLEISMHVAGTRSQPRSVPVDTG